MSVGLSTQIEVETEVNTASPTLERRYGRTALLIVGTSVFGLWFYSTFRLPSDVYEYYHLAERARYCAANHCYETSDSVSKWQKNQLILLADSFERAANLIVWRFWLDHAYGYVFAPALLGTFLHYSVDLLRKRRS